MNTNRSPSDQQESSGSPSSNQCRSVVMMPPPPPSTSSSSSSSAAHQQQQKCPPPRRRLQPSEKQLKQQQSASCHTQRQKSFSNSSQTIMAGLYDLEETLGKGHFATVKAAKHVFTGERVAVKVIDKTKLDSVSQKALLKEVLCMKLVQHPNVVKLYEVIDTSTKMYLVLELGQGDLYDLILRQQGGLPEPEARVYFKQILTAVSYCHKLHVAHRDLKPENVVFFPPPPLTSKSSAPPSVHSKLGQVKLTDFGFSNKFCPGVNLDTSCGSLAYSAPEILLGDSYSGPLADIWSLGVILYMLACGRAPFQEANDSETLTMIMDVKYSIPDNLSTDLKDLIRSMLVRDPNRRANLQEIENHAWVIAGEHDVEQQEQVSAYALPLIVSNSISEHESERIFSEMVNGGVVSNVEEVKSSLKINAYNHVTSTYYLLAERLLREKTRRTRTPTNESTPSTSTPSSSSSANQQSKSPPPHNQQQQQSSQESDVSPPPSPKIRIRKNSHVLEDIVLPSSKQEQKQQQQRPNDSINIASLDLDTTNQQKHKQKFSCLPAVIDEQDPQRHMQRPQVSSPHHPHFNRHLPNINRPKPEPKKEEDSSSSPPKYCNSRTRMNKSHHSHSDSSDEGGTQQPAPSSSSSSTQPPTINIVLSEETRNSPEKSPDSPTSNSSSSHNNNVLLKPSPSYEAIEQDEHEHSRKRGKKKRVLFLSWFFKRSGGGKVEGGKSKSSSSSSSSSRNIYKTKSCSELKTRSCNNEMEMHTRECFGVCNGNAK